MALSRKASADTLPGPTLLPLMDQELDQHFASAKPAAFPSAPAPLDLFERSKPAHISQHKETLKKAKATLGEEPVDTALNAKKEDSPERLARTLFVGNVPVAVAKDKKLQRALRKVFEQFGDIESVRFRSLLGETGTLSKKVAYITGQLSDKRATCNCYVVFASAEDAQRATASCNGHVFESHHLRVDLASNSSQKPQTKKSVFVGNLPLNVREESLWNIFSSCGVVSNVRVVRDRETGMGKGFAYVTFQDRATVELALQLAGTGCEGRPMRVSKCSKPGYQEIKKAHREKRTASIEKFKNIKKPSKADQEPSTTTRPGFSQKGKTFGKPAPPSLPRLTAKVTPKDTTMAPQAAPVKKHPAEIRKERKVQKVTSAAPRVTGPVKKIEKRQVTGPRNVALTKKPAKSSIKDQPSNGKLSLASAKRPAAKSPAPPTKKNKVLSKNRS